MNAHTPSRQQLFFVPWPVLVLIALICTAYAAFALAPLELQDFYLGTFGLIPALYTQGPAEHLALWHYLVPLVSYNFLHGGLEHLGINCLWLLPFGSVVARRFGAGLFFLFFFICGAAGGALHLAVYWGTPVMVIGASGAISGLMAAGFRMTGTGGGERPWSGAGEGALLPLFSRQVLVWSVVWVLVNIVTGVTGMGTGATVQLIAWQVHLGGYFAGLVLAGPFAYLADLNRPPRYPDML